MYKARLVEKGYTQTYGVDYQETFSPVAKMNTLLVLISLAANLNWLLKQFDVKMLFFMGTWKNKYIWISIRGIMPEGKPEYVGCESHFTGLSNHLLHGLVDSLKL